MIILNKVVFDDVWLDALVSVQEEMTDSFARIRKDFAYKTRVSVIAFENAQSLADYLGFGIPIWVKGTGYGDKILVVGREGWVHDFEESIFEVIIHEFAHLAVAERFAVKCPLWLNEGLAIYYSGEYKAMDFAQCRADYPYYEKGYNDGDVFYYQSASMVKHLMERYGSRFLIEHGCKCQDFLHDNIFGAVSLLDSADPRS